MIKFDVLNRWSGKVQFTAELDCEEGADHGIKLGLAVRWAYRSGASLVGASLVGASLVGALLVGARLDGANLVGANLNGANLDGASLVGARLDGANLNGASLVGARLDGASLRSVRADLFDVLIRARPEVPALLQALREGRVDGSAYSGDCACLCGTIANVRHVDVSSLDFRDASRPAERWFLGINKGDTPATSGIAKITEGWIEEFLRFAAPDTAAQAAE